MQASRAYIGLSETRYIAFLFCHGVSCLVFGNGLMQPHPILHPASWIAATAIAYYNALYHRIIIVSKSLSSLHCSKRVSLPEASIAALFKASVAALFKASVAAMLAASVAAMLHAPLNYITCLIAHMFLVI